MLNVINLCSVAFFLGPCQTEKSTLLRKTYPDAILIDLLKAEEFRRYLGNPELLRMELPKNGEMHFVVIDEVQKLPSLFPLLLAGFLFAWKINLE